MPEATPRYLTKSRFKLALECPTKLFYSGKPQLYPDRREGDEFMQSLAEGGFQVGALARQMFSGGVEVSARTHDGQLAETEQLLARQDVTIFEAAVRFGDLFIRIDILRKVGNQVELIEVKAKGHDFTEPLRDVGAMRPYLQDVAFQRHVLRSRHPEWIVTSFLMLADKSAICTVQGLNQAFKLVRHNGRPGVVVAPDVDLGAPILRCAPVDALIDRIDSSDMVYPGGQGRFGATAAAWAQAYANDLRLDAPIGPHCGSCEFHAPPAPASALAPLIGALASPLTNSLPIPVSGFREC